MIQISPQNSNGSILSDNDYAKQKSKIDKELSQIKANIADTDDRADKWMDLAVNTFNFACYAKYHFENGNIDDKKSILAALGSNLKLKDKKLLILLPKHFEIVQRTNFEIKKLNVPLEPKNNGEYYRKTGSLEPAIPYMLGGRESNPD